MKRAQRKPRTGAPQFELPEIRKALQRWIGIWIAEKDFPVSWHNFKWDLMDVKQRRRIPAPRRKAK